MFPSPPPATRALILINIAVSLLQQLLPNLMAGLFALWPPHSGVAVGDGVCAARAALRRDRRAAGRGPLRAPGRDARRGAVHPLLALAPRAHVVAGAARAPHRRHHRYYFRY